MHSQRGAALLALILLAITTVWVIYVAATAFPTGLFATALIALAFVLAWQSLGATVVARVLAAAAVLCLGAALLLLAIEKLWLDLSVIALLLVVSAAATKRTFRSSADLPKVARPKHPVVVWNPKSGGGRAVTANLEAEAKARGFTTIELHEGDDLEALVRTAIDRGADALAAAGGDGTQAIVAGIAVERGLPFACIPAGTRNHFALDLGVDRDDLVGSLDAFVDGKERVVDLGYVNGSPFVNNVSAGLYAEAVHEAGYREAKIRTLLGVGTRSLGEGGEAPDLRYLDRDGNERDSAAMILVSNNAYRLGAKPVTGSGPRMDEGKLGVTVASAPGDPDVGQGRSQRKLLQQWTVESFRIDSTEPVALGVDGEKRTVEPPAVFEVKPGALRVRIAAHHPGASPSAAIPPSVREGIAELLAIASGASTRVEEPS